jgi:PAB1-binding protein PBP1
VDRIMRDRFLFITQQLIGYHVEVQRNDGVWLSGVFHTAHNTTQHNFSIVIKMVRVKGKGEAAAKEAGIELGQTIFMEAKDFVQIFCPSMQIGTNRAVEARTGLMTDSAISGAQKEGLFGRDLTQWEGGDAGEELKGLETDSSGNWDQFEANKRLFNIESTYDENLYTTKLDYEKTDAALAARAEKMALEIAKQPSTNPHIREERGQKLDNNISEEDRFSGVIDTSRTYQNAAPAAKPAQKGTPSNIWARAPKSVKAAEDGEILEDGEIFEKADENPKEKELKSKDAPAPEGSKKANKKKHKEDSKANDEGGDAGKKSKPAEDPSGTGGAKSPGGATDGGAPNAALQQPQQQKPKKTKKVYIPSFLPLLLP